MRACFKQFMMIDRQTFTQECGAVTPLLGRQNLEVKVCSELLCLEHTEALAIGCDRDLPKKLAQWAGAGSALPCHASIQFPQESLQGSSSSASFRNRGMRRGLCERPCG